MMNQLKTIALQLLAITSLIAAASISSTSAASAVSSADCPQPRTVTYNFIHTYNPACSATHNWDRHFEDVTISSLVDGRNTLSATASTALAGAIASVKVNNKEFIGSGGHGSAQQHAFHAWSSDSNASECYNPTQAGSARDDDGHGAPYHGPSTSALYKQIADSPASLSTESRMAMYVPRTSDITGYGDCRPADYQPDTSPFTYGLSPYWLKTQVTVGKQSNDLGLENVIRSQATVISEDVTYEHFNGVLVSYLQRDFTEVYSYSHADTSITKRDRTIASRDPLIRCTATKSYCFAMYFREDEMPADSYYYAMTNPPTAYNGMTGEYTLQITSPSSNIGRDAISSVSYNSYIAVGNLERVRTTLAQLHR